MKKKYSFIFAVVFLLIILPRACFSEGEKQQNKILDVKGELTTGFVGARLFSLYGKAQDFGYHNLKFQFQFMPHEDISFGLGVKNEGVWENKKEDFVSDSVFPETTGQIDIEELCVKSRSEKFRIKEFSLGRQKMTLGSGFLVGDGTPELEFDKDSAAFDALSVEFNTNGLTTDLFASAVEGDYRNIFYGLHSTYPHKNLKTSVEGYAYRLELLDDEGSIPAVLDAYSKKDYVNTLGFRVFTEDILHEGTSFYLECALQEGKLTGNDVGAYAAQAGMKYECPLRSAICARAGFEYTYLSGDDADTAKNEEFIPLFTSREYGPLYTLVREDKNYDVVSNINVSNIVAGARIYDNLDLQADFYYIRQNRPQRTHISDEVVYSAGYSFNDMVSAHVNFSYLDVRETNITTGTHGGNRVVRLITVMTKVRF